MAQNQKLNGSGKSNPWRHVCGAFILYFLGVLWYNTPDDKGVIGGGNIMRKILPWVMLCAFCVPAVAATPASQARRSMRGQMVMSAPRATASTNQISGIASVNTGTPVDTDVRQATVPTTPSPAPSQSADTREKERLACVSNNVGIGNTFVWASRYSNINNYATMVEDVEEPENNVCFVKVDIKSNDSRIDVSDVPSRYFIMGNDITCGSWADEDVLRQRALDAKKTGRTWATVGGVVGGAGLGVGIMELFGNELIGGKVEGQKALSGDQRLMSQLLVLKDKDRSSFDLIMRNLRVLEQECNSDVWDGAEKPDVCNMNSPSYINAEYLLNAERS